MNYKILSLLLLLSFVSQTDVRSQTHQILQDLVNKNEKITSKDSLTSALYIIDKEIEDFPQNYRAYISRGKVKIKLGKFEDAVKDFTLATLIEPNEEYEAGSLQDKFNVQKNAEAYFYRGQTKILTSDYEDAIDDFTTSLQLKPNFNTYIIRGSVRHELGLFEKAIEDFTNAINLEPNNEKAYLIRGSTLIDLNKIREACLDFYNVNTTFEEEARNLLIMYCND